MTRVVIAEYDAKENALRPADPLAGINDHNRVRVATDEPAREGDRDRPWLAMRGILSAEGGTSLAAAIDNMFSSTE